MAAGRGKELLSLFQRAGCLQSGENLSGGYTQNETDVLNQVLYIKHGRNRFFWCKHIVTSPKM